MFLRDFTRPVTEAVTKQRVKAEKPQFSPEEKAILNKLNAEHKQKLAKSYKIRDFCEPLIQNYYLKHEKGLLRAISVYRDKNVEKLSSPYILDNMLFTQSDIDIVFTVCGTTKEKVQEMLDTLDDLPINTSEYFQDKLEGKKIQKRNIIPFRVLLIMILRYYIMQNDMKKAEEIMFYYAGIAKQFDDRFHIRQELKEKFPLGVDRPCCIYINRVFNLVTKEKCFFKPNYRALDEALKDMAFKYSKIRQYLPSDTIVMPKIGCGLDRLEWYAVKPIIKEAFEFIDVRIIICNK